MGALWKSSSIESGISSIGRREEIYSLVTYLSGGNIYTTLGEFASGGRNDSPWGKSRRMITLDLFETYTMEPYYNHVKLQEIDAMLFIAGSVFRNKYRGQAHFLRGQLVGGDAYRKAILPTVYEFREFIKDQFKIKSYSLFSGLLKDSNLSGHVLESFDSIIV